ncbi:MAG TPA: hypothetical protein VFU81_04905, partial [Thermomicrobiales bacterium]|nr:hypothetical protein [Thermomicrobiales bacterium]
MHPSRFTATMAIERAADLIREAERERQIDAADDRAAVRPGFAQRCRGRLGQASRCLAPVFDRRPFAPPARS